MTPRDSHAVPDILYKYRPWDKFSEDLICGRIYFAKREQLNDPFEYRWKERRPKDISAALVMAHHMVRISRPDLPDDSEVQRAVYGQLAISLLNQPEVSSNPGRVLLGVFCVSEVPCDIRMWSHYANNHTGICVGISPRLMKTRSMKKKSAKKRFGRVQYIKDLPVYDSVLLHGPEQGVLNAAATKSSDWSYEKEWRTFNSAGLTQFDPRMITSIICGCAMSEETRSKLKEFIAKERIEAELLQAEMSESEFKIEIRTMKLK